MRVLIYNWIPFDEKENKGGGVTVYTRNLIEALIKMPEIQVYFVSSGRAYDAHNQELRYESTTNIYGVKVSSYQIVNSPVLSSARLSFPYVDDVLNDRSLKDIFRELLNEIGNLDVIHFQNLEGLSLSVLELKEEYPKTKFIYSIHNYYAICPQVMLWRKGSESCELKNTGEECLECLEKDIFKEKVILNQQIQYDKELGHSIEENRINAQKKMTELCKNRNIRTERECVLANTLAGYRSEMVATINKYMDCILAVSKRVRDIVVRCGFKEEKVVVDYIGTAVADNCVDKVLYPNNKDRFRICYLGYPRKNKGFFFLLDALESMDQDMLKKLDIVLAVPTDDEVILNRFSHLSERGANIFHYSGYSHSDLDRVLEGVHLGIVPPLWEDNLPQVAIEMKAKGIPVLSSDMGGAKELSTAEGFVYKACDINDFKKKLFDIMCGKVDVNTYFDCGMKLVSMKEHIKKLSKYYM